MELRISGDGRRILDGAGKPWFYLGDTAWEMFHRLTVEEAKHFLGVRAKQGFTAIQAVLLAEFEGLRVPNAQGHFALHDLDPCKPNEAYFADCDAMVAETARLGMVSAILPTWGDKFTEAWGAGPVVFTPENAFVYGAYVGRRYRDFPVIWVMGGDRPLNTARHLEIVRQMARGIRSASPDQLMTFHPPGGDSSARWVHGESWLDFNMLQTGHTGRNNPVGRMIELDLAREPKKPSLDGEPNYEDHPLMEVSGGQWKQVGNEWFDAFDCRKQAWRGILAGACGLTYGCHDVWQMWEPKREVVNHVRTPWREAILLPGAVQVGHVRRFCESIAWEKLVGDESLFVEGRGNTPAEEGRAGRASDGSYAVIYVPTGRKIRVEMKRLKGGLKGEWVDPRTGVRSEAVGAGDGYQTPTGEDWVLHLRG